MLTVYKMSGEDDLVMDFLYMEFEKYRTPTLQFELKIKWRITAWWS